MLDKHYSCLNYSAISLTLDKRYSYLNHSEIFLMLDKRYSYLNHFDITLMLDKRYLCLNHSDIFLIFHKRYFYQNDLECRADKIRPMDVQTQLKQEALREYRPHPRLVWGSRQLKIESCIQWVKHIITKLFQIVPYVMTDLSWKFHENPFIHITVILLTDLALHLVFGPWSSLIRCETV